MNEPQKVYLLIFGLILLGAFMLCIITSIIYRHKPQKDGSQIDDDPAEPEFQRLEINATVVDLACGVEVKGHKTVKAVKTFRVAFALENGKVITLTVPEEMYEGIEIGQKGLLTLVDGELYGFEL